MGAGYRLEEHGLQFRAVILRVKRFISLQFHQLVVMNENNWSASMHLIHEFGEAGSGLVYGQRFHGFILAPQSMMGNRKKTSGHASFSPARRPQPECEVSTKNFMQRLPRIHQHVMALVLLA